MRTYSIIYQNEKQSKGIILLKIRGQHFYIKYAFPVNKIKLSLWRNCFISLCSHFVQICTSFRLEEQNSGKYRKRFVHLENLNQRTFLYSHKLVRIIRNRIFKASTSFHAPQGVSQGFAPSWKLWKIEHFYYLKRLRPQELGVDWLVLMTENKFRNAVLFCLSFRSLSRLFSGRYEFNGPWHSTKSVPVNLLRSR